MAVVPDPRTERRRAGDRAETIAAGYLERLGWRVIARNVRSGRLEVDLVAIEPGEQPTLVFVEVRSRSGAAFGAPEESVVGRKALGMYRAAAALVARGSLPDGQALPRIAWRVDLVAVVSSPAGEQIRHLRGVDPA